jgi:hypothetical protein
MINSTTRDGDRTAAPTDMLAGDVLTSTQDARVVLCLTDDGHDPAFGYARRAAASLADRLLLHGMSLAQAVTERVRARVLVAHPDGHVTLARPQPTRDDGLESGMNAATGRRHHAGDADSDALQLTWHPDAITIVASLWHDNLCIGMLRLDSDQAHRLARLLASVPRGTRVRGPPHHAGRGAGVVTSASDEYVMVGSPGGCGSR